MLVFLSCGCSLEPDILYHSHKKFRQCYPDDVAHQLYREVVCSNVYCLVISVMHLNLTPLLQEFRNNVLICLISILNAGRV